MGYKIKVNHSQFDKTAQALDDYVSKMSKQMSSADFAMKTMFFSWKGIDASAYKTKWDKVMNSDSTYGNMKKTLTSYSKYLRNAGNKYKNAQANAINRANKLSKW